MFSSFCLFLSTSYTFHFSLWKHKQSQPSVLWNLFYFPQIEKVLLQIWLYPEQRYFTELSSNCCCCCTGLDCCWVVFASICEKVLTIKRRETKVMVVNAVLSFPCDVHRRSNASSDVTKVKAECRWQQDAGWFFGVFLLAAWKSGILIDVFLFLCRFDIFRAK